MLTRLAYADYLELSGKVIEANMWRKLVRLGLFPADCRLFPSREYQGWVWFRCDEEADNDNNSVVGDYVREIFHSNTLNKVKSKKVFRHMASRRNAMGFGWWPTTCVTCFHTRIKAEQALIDAWMWVKEKKRVK
jgi:hypothetical protein